MTRQGSFREFDGTPAAVRIYCREWLQHPAYRDMRVGSIGVILNRGGEECALFLHRRRDAVEGVTTGRKKTWNDEYGGYAISDRVLTALRRRHIDTILLGVTDREVLHEYARHQYEHGPTFEWRDNDTQSAVGPPDETALVTYGGSNVAIIDPGDDEPKRLADKHLDGSGTRRHES